MVLVLFTNSLKCVRQAALFSKQISNHLKYFEKSRNSFQSTFTDVALKKKCKRNNNRYEIYMKIKTFMLSLILKILILNLSKMCCYVIYGLITQYKA